MSVVMVLRRGGFGRVGLWTALAALALALAPPNALFRGQRALSPNPVAGSAANSTEEDHVSGLGSEEIHGHSRVKARARRAVPTPRRPSRARRLALRRFRPSWSARPPRAHEPRFVVPRWDDDPPLQA